MPRNSQHIGRLASRVSWSLGDQVLSSLSNFALSVFVARAVSAAELGIFALCYSGYVLALGVVRAATAEPLMVKFGSHDLGEARRAGRSALGVAILLGGACGGVVLLAAWIGPSEVQAPFMALGLSLPALLTQDAARFCAFTFARPKAAFLSDLVWTAVQIPCLMYLSVTGHLSTASALTVWGASSFLAAGGALVQLRLAPTLGTWRAWVRENRSLIPGYAGEFMARLGTAQMVLYVVGLVAGLTQLGALKAAQIAFGPVRILFWGLMIVAIPEAARLYRSRADRLLTTTRILALGLLLFALLWGVTLNLLPGSVGVAFLGEAWEHTQRLLWPMTAYMMAYGAVTGPLIGLRVIQAAGTSFRARIASSGLILLTVPLGAARAGARGAAICMALASWSAYVVWTRAFRRASRCAETTSAFDSGALVKSITYG